MTATVNRDIFFDHLRALIASKREDNCFYFTQEKYSKILSEVKFAKFKCSTPLDYRRLKRFDVLKSDTGDRLIVPLKPGDTSIQYYVTNDELFNILSETHIRLCHGGRTRMAKELQVKYKNITYEAVMLYINLCQHCQTTHRAPRIGFATNPMGNESFARDDSNSDLYFDQADQSTSEISFVDPASLANDNLSLIKEEPMDYPPSTSFTADELQPFSNPLPVVSTVRVPSLVSIPSTSSAAETSTPNLPLANVSKPSILTRPLVSQCVKKSDPLTVDQLRKLISLDRGDEFDAFGRAVAIQLRKLKVPVALKLQIKIQTLLKNEVINQSSQEESDIDTYGDDFSESEEEPNQNTSARIPSNPRDIDQRNQGTYTSRNQGYFGSGDQENCDKSSIGDPDSVIEMDRIIEPSKRLQAADHNYEQTEDIFIKIEATDHDLDENLSNIECENPVDQPLPEVEDIPPPIADNTTPSNENHGGSTLISLQNDGGSHQPIFDQENASKEILRKSREVSSKISSEARGTKRMLDSSDDYSFKKPASKKSNKRFLEDKENTDEKILTNLDSTDIFFQSMLITLKTLPPSIIAEAKMKICSLVSELELRALEESSRSINVNSRLRREISTC